MNRPNKLVIPCKRARVFARSDHPETMPIKVEPGIPTELPAASRRPGPSKTRSAAIHRCGKSGARLRRPQCGRMRRKLDAIATHRLGAIERLICHIQQVQDRNSHRPRLLRRRWPWRKAAHPPTCGWWLQTINEQIRHGAGDGVLTAFCQLATSLLRPTDLFGRIGGEEFASLHRIRHAKTHSCWRNGCALRALEAIEIEQKERGRPARKTGSGHQPPASSSPPPRHRADQNLAALD